nr:hypothetical protein [Tanacetum cinerariifolium]
MPKCEIFEAVSDSSVSEIDEDNNQAKDRYKVGIGYHVVPPPYTRNYMLPRADLSFIGLNDPVFKFKISETRTSVNENESIASKSSEEIREEPKTVRSSAPIIQDWESDYEDECEDKTSTEQDKSSNDNSVKSIECIKKYVSKKYTNNHDENLRKRQDSKVDWNGMKTQKQGIGFKFNKMAYFVCGSVNHLIKDCTFYENKMVEKYVVNNKASTSTARPNVNTAAIRPNVNAKSSYFKPHFPKKRHFNQRSATKTNTFSRKINTANGKNVTTAGPKAVVDAAEGKKENAVNGCSKHMMGNKSFLTEYQEIDGGFIAFVGSPKGGKIIGKGKIRTGKLDFEDVYLVMELKFNLFPISQIFDLKNVVPTGDLTCLFAKATINRVLVTKPHNKTPHKLLISRSPNLKFMRPFGCPVTILNTLDHLGKYDGKADEGFLVGYSVNSKAFRVFSSRTRKVEENLHEKAVVHEYILLPFIPSNQPLSSTIQSSYVNAGDKPGDVDTGDKPGDVNAGDIQGNVDEISRNDDVCQGNEIRIDSSTHVVNAASPSVNTASNIIDRLDANNLDSFTVVSPIPTTKVHKDHPKEQIIGDPNLNTQTRRMINFSKETTMIKAMQEELFQFKLQDVWTLVDLPYGKKAIGSKWIFKNKLDERVSRIEAIRLFLAYASFKDFIVYQMDVKSAFLYGTIEVEVYVCQPPGFEDPGFLDKVYKVKKALYGLHQALRAWYGLYEFNGELTFFVGLFSEVKTASTPMETSKPLLKDEDRQEVDVHMYRSMIGSLMYLTSSRPDIMFVVCTCARHQVSPKASYLHAVKRIFRYLKGQPKVGLWYPKDSPFELEAYTDSDYVRSSLDMKSTTGDVNSLAVDLYPGSVKTRKWLQTPQLRLSMLLLQVIVDRKLCFACVGFQTTPQMVINSTCLTDKKELASPGQSTTVKKFNDQEQKQALVDKKKVIITEDSIRSDLRFDDAKGTACLLNETIFEGLARMGTMAFAIICLADNQKFNFS